MKTPPTEAQMVRKAKAWGNANGFEGGKGGWIYRVTGTGQRYAHCQGWWSFYQIHKKKIEESS